MCVQLGCHLAHPPPLAGAGAELSPCGCGVTLRGGGGWGALTSLGYSRSSRGGPAPSSASEGTRGHASPRQRMYPMTLCKAPVRAAACPWRGHNLPPPALADTAGPQEGGPPCSPASPRPPAVTVPPSAAGTPGSTTVNSQTRVRGWFCQRNAGLHRSSQRAQPGAAVRRHSESRTHRPTAQRPGQRGRPGFGRQGARTEGRGPRRDVAAGLGSGSHGRQLSKASSRPLWPVGRGAGPSVLLKPSVQGPAALGLAPPSLGATLAPAGPLATTRRPGGSRRSERSPCRPTGPGHSRQAASVRAGGVRPPVTAQLLWVRPGRCPDPAQPTTQPCSAGRAAPAGVTECPRP